MLYSISVNNYRSIEKTNLTLRYSRKRAPASHKFSDYLPFMEDGKIRAVPVLVIYGANSSGKSTLLSALKTLSSIVKNGHDGKYYTPDRMLSGRKKPASHSIWQRKAKTGITLFPMMVKQ